MRKKFLYGALAAAMMLSMTACGTKDNTKDTPSSEIVTEASEDVSSETDVSTTGDTETPSGDVTAESLIDGLSDAAHADETVDADIDMNVEMSMSLPDESGNAQDYNINMNVDLHSVSSKTVSHTEGSMVSDMSGETENTDVEIWVTNDDNGVASYIKNGDSWIKSVETTNSFNAATTVSSFKSDMFSDLKLEEEDEGYYVTGFIDANSLSNVIGSLDSSTMSSGISQPVAVEMFFNKDTRELNGINFDMSDAVKSAMESSVENSGANVSDSNYSVNIDRYVFSIMINGYSKDALEVPEDVISTAVVENEDTDIVDDTESDDFEDEDVESPEVSTEAEQ